MPLLGYYNSGEVIKMWIKRNGGILLIVLLGVLPGLLFWKQLPSAVPIHWGIGGHVNGTATRLNAILVGPLINLVLFFFLLNLPKIDPKRDNYEKFKSTYELFRWIIHLFLTLIQVMVIWNGVLIYKGTHPLNVESVLPPVIGLLFVVLGNYTTRVRPNFFIGIRTPWALVDEYVWERTNRFGGRVFVIIGLISILSLLFPVSIRFYFFTIPLLVGIVVIVAYSYIVYTNKR